MNLKELDENNKPITALPWKVEEETKADDPRGLGIDGTSSWGKVYSIVNDELFVGFVLQREDADFIVNACNSFINKTSSLPKARIEQGENSPE